MNYNTELSGKRIAELRKKEGLSQANLSEKIGLHLKTISKAERGVNGLSVDNLIALAEYFRVSLEYLVGIEEKEQFEMLREQGIDYIQGYYFSKPLPEKEFLEYLSK